MPANAHGEPHDFHMTEDGRIFRCSAVCEEIVENIESRSRKLREQSAGVRTRAGPGAQLARGRRGVDEAARKLRDDARRLAEEHPAAAREDRRLHDGEPACQARGEPREVRQRQERAADGARGGAGGADERARGARRAAAGARQGRHGAAGRQRGPAAGALRGPAGGRRAARQGAEEHRGRRRRSGAGARRATGVSVSSKAGWRPPRTRRSRR